MTLLSENNIVKCFKELPPYNEPIKKTKIKRLKNNDLLTELPFFEKNESGI